MPSIARTRRVVESDDEEPTHTSSATSAHGPALSRREPGSSHQAHTDQIVDSIDLAPSPLGREQVPNVKRLLAEFQYQNKIITDSIKLLIETAEQTAEAFRNQEHSELLGQADVDLRQLIDLQVEKAIRRSALEGMMQDLEGGLELSEPNATYTTAVQEQLDAYLKKTSRQKYGKNVDYYNFRDAVWAATEEGAMPPVRDLIVAEDGDEDDSDDDIVAGGQTQNFRCPLTVNLLEDPLTSTVCKHSYSKEAILEYVGQGSNKCPAAGCAAVVSRRTLREDPQLKKKVASFKRREQERLLTRRQDSTILD